MGLHVPGWLRYRRYAILVACLIGSAFILEFGELAGSWHTSLHRLTFALVALMGCWAWPSLKWYWQLVPALALPVIQDVCEMYGYGHGLEWSDILVDSRWPDWHCPSRPAASPPLTQQEIALLGEHRVHGAFVF